MHYKVALNEEEFLELIGKLISDLSDWDSNNLQVGINHLVKPENWQLISQNIDHHEARLRAAKQCAKGFNDALGIEINEICHECGYETAHINQHAKFLDEIVCAYCEASSLTLECDQCGRLSPDKNIHSFFDKDKEDGFHILTCAACVEKNEQSNYEEYLNEQLAGL